MIKQLLEWQTHHKFEFDVNIDVHTALRVLLQFSCTFPVYPPLLVFCLLSHVFTCMPVI